MYISLIDFEWLHAARNALRDYLDMTQQSGFSSFLGFLTKRKTDRRYRSAVDEIFSAIGGQEIEP